MKTFFLGVSLLFATTANAELQPAKDLGFRYVNGKCVNSKGETGLNPSIFGQCSDLRGVILSRFDFSDIDFSGSQMANSDFQKSSFMGATLVGVNFDNSNLSGVNFDSAKILNSSFKKAVLRNVTMVDSEVDNSQFNEADFVTSNFSYAIFKNSNLTKANFKGVPLDQASFLNCTLTEVDMSSTTLSSGNFANSMMSKANLSNSNLIKANFSGGTLEAVNFAGSQLRYANFSKASMKNSKLTGLTFSQANLDQADLTGSDIRGSELSEAKLETAILKDVLYNRRTVLPFSEDMAKQKGMIFKKANSTLILPDVKNASLEMFVKALTELGDEVTVSSGLEYQFDGVREKLTNYDVVIHLNAQTFENDIPMTGQTALVEFVQRGGTFIYGEWNSYEVGQGRLRGMVDLNLYKLNDTNGNKTMTLFKTEVGAASGLLDGVADGVAIPVNGWTDGEIAQFSSQPVQVLMKEQELPVVVGRNLGAGQVIGFRFNCNEGQNGGNCLRNKDLQRLYFNAGYLTF